MHMEKERNTDELHATHALQVLKSAVERDREMSKRWIAEYLSGMDEDDFRKRYFKNMDYLEEKQGSKSRSNSNKQAAPPLERQESMKSQGGCPPFDDDEDKDTASPNCVQPLDSDKNDRDTQGIVVHKAADAYSQWVSRTADECRLWYLKTLKMHKILSDTPSIKEQKSSPGSAVIIFDWDDTLICTTYLGKMKGLVDMSISDQDRRILAKIDQTAVDSPLTSARCCGSLSIWAKPSS